MITITVTPRLKRALDAYAEVVRRRAATGLGTSHRPLLPGGNIEPQAVGRSSAFPAIDRTEREAEKNVPARLVAGSRSIVEDLDGLEESDAPPSAGTTRSPGGSDEVRGTTGNGDER